MYGIMRLKKGGGPPGSGPPGSEKHAGYKGYKTGSRKGTDAGDKGDKKSQANTARELNKMIKSGDLDRLVTRGRQDQDYRSGFSSPSTVIGGMTQKQQDFIARNRRKDGSLNSAAQSILDFYSDDRSDYQRDLNKFIKSSPGAREAYLDRFPIGGALNLGIPAAFNALAPAPLKMLGSMVGDIGKGAYTAAKQGLGYLVPKQIREDVGPGVQKLWGDIKDAPSGFGRDAKALLTGKLSPIETANLGIIKDEQQDEQNPLEKLIKGDQTSEDTHDAILEDLLGSLDTSQDIAYDPTQDIEPGEYGKDAYWKYNDPQGSKAYETEDWLGDVQPKIDAGMWEGYGETYDPFYDEELGEMEPHGPQYQTEDWLGEIQPKLDAIKKQQQEEKLNQLFAIEGAGNPDIWNDNPFTDQDRTNFLGNLTQDDILTGSDLYPEVFTNADGGYLKKYDDGGYANMSTYEKLKAINDSIAEG